MTDIQKARDVLAKCRKQARSAGPQEHFWFTSGIDQKVKPLIILTAGNPELLDAIDVCLEVGADYADLFEGALPPTGAPGRVLAHANRIAAAIIAADERMSA